MRKNTSYKLLPCPFCGASAHVEHCLTCGYDSYWVECDDYRNCGGRAGGVTDCEAVAVDNWNTRVGRRNND